MSMDLRRLPWHFGMILSVLMMKNYMKKKSLAIILGTEGDGLAAETMADC